MSAPASTADAVSFLDEGYTGKKVYVTPHDESSMFVISEQMARKIASIKFFLDTSSSDAEHIFPAKRVPTAELLHKILVFVKYHVNEPIPAAEETRAEKLIPMSDWNREYIGKDLKNIFELLLAADYLDIPDLKHVCCRMAAEIGNTRSAAQLRNMYNLPDDLTPEELEQANAYNAMFSQMRPMDPEESE